MSEEIRIQTKPLSELVIINNGIDYKKNPKGNEEIPIYGTGGIMGYTSIALNEGPAVLTGRKGSINRPFYLEGKFWNVDTIFCLKPIGANNAKWLYYSILNIDMTKLNEATGIPSITSKSLYRLKINHFEPDKQREIAHILTTCDTVIEQTKSAIAKYKAIKQGLLHDLFTRGLDANGHLRPCYQDAPELYQESELGMIPKEWEVKRLEECTTYVDYRGKTPPKSDRGIVLVTAKNIRFGFIDYELSKEYIYEYAFESAMSRGKAFIGDVLITTEAPMGNVAQIDKEGIALAQRVIKYQGQTNKLNNDFLKLALMSDGFQMTLVSEATGSTALGIKGSRLHKLKILIPKIKEQKGIAQRIKIIDNQIQYEETLLQKYQSIKRGLMEDLLGGKMVAVYG